MSFLTIILIAVGLSMDCLAVSISCSISRPKREWMNAILLAAIFGVFHICMPFLGWLIGSRFASQLQEFDHWLAFGILGFIGGKMIYEAFKCKDGEEKSVGSRFLSWQNMLLLPLATSIDALATGLIFVTVLNVIYKALIIFALVCFFFSILGFAIGWYFQRLFKFRFEFVGGVILIFIGTKILIEHLFFS